MKHPEHKEGFWYSKYEPELPMPVACPAPAKDQKEFLAALAEREERANETAYRGWSTCRICGCHNGSREFSSRGWAWPQGYRHYIEQHNVRPSPEFKKFILGE